MNRIESHPILKVPESEKHYFNFEGKKIAGLKGYTIASALHQAGYPVHSHSIKNRNRSLECGIGKCGACEMLVDGEVKRICITKVDDVKEVREIPREYHPEIKAVNTKQSKVYRTAVAIIGAGPSGLAAREELLKAGIDNLVVDNNDKIGGQFLMQTHQFFFFEKEKKFGGMRGFEIAESLAGESEDGIILNATVWDIYEGNKLAVKNIKTNEVFYVEAEYLVVATGAVPYMPAFENDDLPGVYTAAVVQKMMNNEFTLLGKNILTVGAGNIGYLTSYQLFQAGVNVRGIIEARDVAGGFPVQANRIRRLGIPVITSHILIKALPNQANDGIMGAVIAEFNKNGVVPGTEKLIDGIDAINICTGLVSDDLLLRKGQEVFGRNCFGAGDSIRIGEGTSAVLRGKQVAFDIMESMGINYNYKQYLSVSKEYIDSQQEPLRILEKPAIPDVIRQKEKPFVILDCLFGFACNPCEFACPHNAITKTSTSTVPVIDYEKCTGCMECVYQCPGLAIFGFNLKTGKIFIPLEYAVEADSRVWLMDNNGDNIGQGILEKVLHKPNKTHIARIKLTKVDPCKILDIRGFSPQSKDVEKLVFKTAGITAASEKFICHCDDVKMEDILEVIGERKFISVDEIKHTTRLGMGACRGKRCIKRLKQSISAYGIQIVGEPTPRGPMSNQVNMGEIYPSKKDDKLLISTRFRKIHKSEVNCLIAGGGIGGSALFRYLSEKELFPAMLNYGHGASWRNIAGGRPAFSVPELSEIAKENHKIFRDLQKIQNIDYYKIKYVTFAHDEEMQEELQKSMTWQKALLIEPKDFKTFISPGFNALNGKYLSALLTDDCWQANPGKTVDLIRNIGLQHGGKIFEDTRLIELHKQGESYLAITKNHDGSYSEIKTGIFINALGPEGGEFAEAIGFETSMYPVRHQAFITRRLPMLGPGQNPLPMLIDRQKYKGFTAVYGQQLAETGQIIGCASPAVDPLHTSANLKMNTRDFAEIVSEVFIDWLPELSSVGFQAFWSGYYVEPRMIIDPGLGLFIGLRGQGFMLGQYLAKMYVDKLTGAEVPEYFERLSLQGDGLLEKAFK